MNPFSIVVRRTGLLSCLLAVALLVSGCFGKKISPDEAAAIEADSPQQPLAQTTAEPFVKPAEDVQPSKRREEPEAFAGMLDAHNRWRRAVNTPSLGWSPAAARVAQAWADQLAQRECKISHSPGTERRVIWGENVYSYWRGGAYEGWRKAPDFVVDRWAGESQWYDPATHTCNAPRGSVCGHYTQIVSAYTTHVGCGRARCNSAEVWVCNYSPPGNYAGVPPY